MTNSEHISFAVLESLKKPLTFAYVSVRIYLVSVHGESRREDGDVRFRRVAIGPVNAQLWRGDEAAALAPKSFDVLCRLVDHPGELVTKHELLDAVWPNLHVTESSLSFAINAIRMALADNAQAPRYIN